MTFSSFLGKKNPPGLLSSSPPRIAEPEDPPKSPSQPAEFKLEPTPRDVARAIRIVAESNGLAPQIERINWSAEAVKAAWETFRPGIRRYLNACVKLERSVDLCGRGGDYKAYVKTFERTAADSTDIVIDAITRGAEILPGREITTEIGRRASKELKLKAHMLQHFEDEFAPVKRVHIVDRKTRPARVLFLQAFEADLFKSFAMPTEPDTPRREISWFTYDGSDWDYERGWYVPQGIQRASKVVANDESSPPPRTVNKPSQNSKI